jgi:phage shock protein A
MSSLLESGDYEEQKDKKIRDRIKELWKRPGGTFAKITGIAALGAIGWGLYKALPFLITLASNTIFFVLEMVVLAILLYVVTSKEFRRGIQLLWLQITRKIYGLIVDIDPISILKNGIAEMEKKMSKVRKSVTDLEALLVNLRRKKKEYEEEFSKNKRDREVIEKKLKDPRISESDRESYTIKEKLLANSIVRGAEQLKRQTERISKSEQYLKIMKKLEKAAEYKISDASDQLKYMENEYEQAKAQTSAVRSINSILSGGLSRSMEEELALDSINSTINESIAEMNRLLDGSNDILINFDIESESNLQLADEIMKVFDEKGFGIFDSSEKKQINASTFTEVDYEEVKEGEKVPAKRRWT